MPLYESVIIARQDISAQQVENLTEQLSTIITDNGGTVARTEYWGLRSLAYKIKKNRKGHYVLMNMDAPIAAMNEFGRTLGLNEDVLRQMIIRVDEQEEGPSVVMQNKHAKSGPRRDRDAPAPRERSDAPAPKKEGGE